VLYAACFLVGAGLLGAFRPHLELQQCERVTATVVGNDLAYQNAGVYGFRLQLKWSKPDGENRTTITTPVRAASEAEARRKYPGAHIQAGETRVFYTAQDDPDRILPFRGYNWQTFGGYAMLTVSGLSAFGIGMWLIRRGKAASASSAP
jgi:hypothetical protein